MNSDQTTDQSSITDNEKKAKERSPSYPAIGLRRAVDLAQKLWDSDRRQAVLVSRAATNLGFSAKSSAGQLALAAMKKYGLLDDEGSGPARKVKLTDPAIAILNPSSANRQQLIKEAALRPTIIAELWGKYGPDGASPGSIQDYLVFERRFNGDAAKLLIEVYNDTVAFASLLEDDKLDQTLEASTGSEKEEDKKEAPTASVVHVEQQQQKAAPPPQGLIDIPVPLPSGALAYYRVPPSMTPGDFDFYTAVLSAYRQGLVKVKIEVAEGPTE